MARLELFRAHFFFPNNSTNTFSRRSKLGRNCFGVREDLRAPRTPRSWSAKLRGPLPLGFLVLVFSISVFSYAFLWLLVGTYAGPQ